MWDLKIFGFDLYFLFYNFILYSFFGWIYESSYVSAKNKKAVNRGFLTGPVIPIYGAGATIIYIFLFSIRNQVFLVFLGGVCLATILEFVTSYVMEKLFHAKWWDYSNFKFNLQGRVCLFVSLFWGLLSVLMTQLIQPLMNRLILSIPRKPAEYIAYVIIILFLADLISTVVSTLKLDQKLTSLHKIREEFMEYLESTKLYETGEELKIKFAESQFSDFIDNIKERLEENLDKISQKYGTKEEFDRKAVYEEISEKVKNFKGKFQKKADEKQFIQWRLLKAFPNLKTKDREDALRELKERLSSKKK